MDKEEIEIERLMKRKRCRVCHRALGIYYNPSMQGIWIGCPKCMDFKKFDERFENA